MNRSRWQGGFAKFLEPLRDLFPPSPASTWVTYWGWWSPIGQPLVWTPLDKEPKLIVRKTNFDSFFFNFLFVGSLSSRLLLLLHLLLLSICLLCLLLQPTVHRSVRCLSMTLIRGGSYLSSGFPRNVTSSGWFFDLTSSSKDWRKDVLFNVRHSPERAHILKPTLSSKNHRNRQNPIKNQALKQSNILWRLFRTAISARTSLKG